MKKLSVLALSAVVVTAMAGAAFADDGSLSSSTKSSDKGSFNTNSPELATVVTLPFRVVTGGAGAVVGFTGGTAKGIVTGVQDAVKYAADESPANHQGASVSENIARGIMYVPTLGLSTVVFVPKNVLEHSLKGAVDFGTGGAEWWDKF